MKKNTDTPKGYDEISMELEEAVKKGINTSDMAPDLGKEIASLTMKTETKSVDAALNIIRSFKSVKEQVGRGKITSVEALYTRQATQDILLEKLKDPEYLNRLKNTQAISSRQYESLRGFKGDYGELQKKVGAGGAEYLTTKMAREVSPTELLNRTFKRIKAQWGTGPEAKQKFSVFAAGQGFALKSEQIETMFKKAEPGTIDKGLGATGAASLEKRGKDILRKKYRGVAPVLGAVGREGQREKLRTGELASRIAGETMAVESALLKMVSKSSATAADGITKLVGTLSSIDKKLDILKGSSDLFKGLINPLDTIKELLSSDKTKDKGLTTK